MLPLKKEMDPKMKKGVDDCNKCRTACLMTINHCLKMGGVHVEPRHMNLLKDCAEICKSSENFMLRDSEHAECICEECARICEQCAESCEKIDPNDAQMSECAKMCRECATSCKAMP